MLNKLSLITLYYNQPDALKFHINNFLSYKKEVLKKIEIIIVDDGSMKYPAINVLTDLNAFEKLPIVLHRIDVDIKWNMPEANNVAFDNCHNDYICRFDIDHFFTDTDISKLLETLIDENSFFTFDRICDGKYIKPSPNAYITHIKLINDLKGYNEYFSGNYGYDDIDFYERVSKRTTIKKIDVCIQVNPYYSTPDIIRDSSINKKKLRENKRPAYRNVHKDSYLINLR